ncbi:unnamed protein product [Medioppia subpectinata]|uniref:Uncharacterized protein n=1 Tax=Medioppia subpectinata TaxID=1979941 RepID=A0A7R9L8D2_9ACAR|nr:unnamed protein product [Medioppia subpectinata]CAG2116814.1 unnamed protein product [Medioppia subpectinata]
MIMLSPKLGIPLFRHFYYPKGCDTGFGHRLAVRLNERGFRVYATVISESSAGAIELPTNARFPDKMHVLAMDVTRDNHVQRAYKYIKLHLKEKCHGDYLWALVNNAGICNECPIEWGTEEMYEQVFAVNMFGVIRVTRDFLPLIRASQGRVVNVSCIMGRISMSPIGWYCMSKHAVIAFSDTLRREMRSFGVRVVTIEPSGFRTGITDDRNRFGKICRTWRHTSTHIQKAYGNEYLDGLKEMIIEFNAGFHLGDNIDIVVNDMIDAIESVEPRLE